MQDDFGLVAEVELAASFRFRASAGSRHPQSSAILSQSSGKRDSRWYNMYL